MLLNRQELDTVLSAELAGQQDSAGRGEWTLDHCRRTARLVLTLRQAVGETAALDELLYTAALFHDVSHDTAAHENHCAEGARRFRELLAGKVPPQLLEQAAAIIAVHDDRCPQDGRSAAAHLVQDADMLDHFGATRVWADFGFAARHGRDYDASLARLELVQAKRERYLTLLHFEVSRRELCKRLDFEAAFTAFARAQSCGELKL